MSSAAPPCILPNPDIAGIGVRVSIYAQALLVLIPATLYSADGKITTPEYEHTKSMSTTTLITACALLLSSFVQGATFGLSVYHAIIILNLSWINNTTFIIYFLFHILNNDDPSPDMLSISRLLKHLQDRGAHIVVGLASVHLSVMAALGLWLWSLIGTFGSQPQCTLQTFAVIFGHNIPATNKKLHFVSLILYSFAAIPLFNIYTACIMLIPCVVIPLFAIDIVTRSCRGLLKTNDTNKSAFHVVTYAAFAYHKARFSLLFSLDRAGESATYGLGMAADQRDTISPPSQPGVANTPGGSSPNPLDVGHATEPLPDPTSSQKISYNFIMPRNQRDIETTEARPRTRIARWERFISGPSGVRAPAIVKEDVLKSINHAFTRAVEAIGRGDADGCQGLLDTLARNADHVLDNGLRTSVENYIVVAREFVQAKKARYKELTKIACYTALSMTALIDIIFLVDTELMIQRSKAMVQAGESQWTFGQTLAVLLVVFPVLKILKGIWEAWKSSHIGPAASKG